MDKIKNEYSVVCTTFEGEQIDGCDFEEPLYSHQEFMDYKPTLDEIKKAYGKGWEFVRLVTIITMPENSETSDDYIEESIKVNEYMSKDTNDEIIERINNGIPFYDEYDEIADYDE